MTKFESAQKLEEQLRKGAIWLAIRQHHVALVFEGMARSNAPSHAPDWVAGWNFLRLSSAGRETLSRVQLA